MKIADQSHNHTFWPACCAAVNMKNADQKNEDQKLQVRCAVNIEIADQLCVLKLLSIHVMSSLRSSSVTWFGQPEQLKT